MHRFEYLAKAFWDIHDWAADLRDDLYALPWPLSYLGYPFDWFRYHMWWVAFNTDRISSWADDVWDRLGDIPTWYDTYWLIRKYFPLLNKTWYDITNYVRDQINRIEVPRVPSYSEIFRNIRSMLVSAYSILSETKDSVIYAADVHMRATYTILWWTPEDIINAAIKKMKATFPILAMSAQDMLKWMGIDAGAVITTILDTPHDMFMWLKKEFDDAYSILSETKESIINDTQMYMRRTFSILSETRDTIIDASITKMKASFPILTMSAQDILKWMGIDAGDVITTILDTPHDMFMWLKKEFERAYDVLLHSWSDVHGLILTYLDTLQDWSQDSWDDFVTKILAALPHIPSIDDVIDYVCDRFESILDRIFKEGS